MPFVISPPRESTPPITARLAGLGQIRRLVSVVAGVLTLMAVIGAAVAGVCLLDALFHWPAALRVLALAGILTVGGVLFVRKVVRPAQESAHPLAVALRLERMYPPLNDSVASAVEFLTVDEATADRLGSARFRRMAISQASTLLDHYNLDRVIPSGKAWTAFWLALLAGLVLCGLTILDPTRAAVALTRLLDPYGDHPFPTRATIELQEPAIFPARHAKGDPLDLKFLVRGQIPDQAVVRVRLRDGPVSEDRIPFAATNPPAREQVGELRLDAGRIPRDFDLRILAHDADTGWLSVTVAPPPNLIPREGRPSPQVTLTAPAYTDLPTLALPDGAGIAEAVTGTRLTLQALADRPIASAVIRPQFDLLPVRAAAIMSLLVGDNGLSQAAAYSLLQDAAAEVPVTVSGSHRDELSAEWTPRLPGLYALRFTDDTGLTGVRLLDLRIFPDPAPAVALLRPEPDQGPLTLLPTAMVPLLARAEDRTFAVRSMALEYQINEEPRRILPLIDFAAAEQIAASVLGGMAGLPHLRPPGADITARSMPVATFVKSDGTPPIDGDTITLRVIATDWDDLAWTKDPGRSQEVEIRVASRSGIEALLQAELAKLRPELLRAREEQRGIREAVIEARQADPPEAAAKLARAEQAQRELRNKIMDPTEGVRAKAERLRQLLRANPLQRSPTAERAEAVADDLARLAEDHLEATDPLLDTARRAAETGDRAALTEAASKASQEQQSAERLLDSALERLDQWGGAGEVRGGARAIKDQLQKAGADAAKATAAIPTGKPVHELSPREKQDLDNPASKLDELAQRADRLLNQAGRLASEKDKHAEAMSASAAEKDQQAAAAEHSALQDPGTEVAAGLRAAAEALRTEAAQLRKAADAARAEAEALRQAVAAAGGNDLPDDLRAAADALRQNQPGNAAARRQSAADRLDQLANALMEKRTTDEVEELRKKRQAASQDAERIAEAQEELQKQAQAASQLADPRQRDDALRKLALDQDKLRRRTEDLAERLTRDKEHRSAEAARQAADMMAEARDELDQGRLPVDRQDQALDKLDETLDRLESQDKQEQEQLSREQREELIDRLAAIRDRQAAVLSEAERIHNAVLAAEEWSRGQLRSYTELEPSQASVADEVRSLTEKHLSDMPVFHRLANQAAQAMDRAARKSAERVQDTIPGESLDVDAETAADERVRGPMRTALRRLDQILEAVTAQENPSQPATPPDAADRPPGNDDGSGPAGAARPSIPPLAQLKALRAVQAEVNERTAAFAKAHPHSEPLTDDDRDELKELEQIQREIAELFEALAPLLQPSGWSFP